MNVGSLEIGNYQFRPRITGLDCKTVKNISFNCDVFKSINGFEPSRCFICGNFFTKDKISIYSSNDFTIHYNCIFKPSYK